MGCPRVGLSAPLVISPTAVRRGRSGSRRVPPACPRRRGPRAPGAPVGAALGEARLADEVLLVGDDDAAEAGLRGDDVERQLVAVEGHARLRAEGCRARRARRAPGRAAAPAASSASHRAPGVRHADVELEAVLARVAGAGDEQRCAAERGIRRRIVRKLRERTADVGDAVDVGKDRQSRRTLHGDQRVVVRHVVDGVASKRAARSASAAATGSRLPAFATTKNLSSARR